MVFTVELLKDVRDVFYELVFIDPGVVFAVVSLASDTIVPALFSTAEQPSQHLF
jgi:hypothetical protein